MIAPCVCGRSEAVASCQSSDRLSAEARRNRDCQDNPSRERAFWKAQPSPPPALSVTAAHPANGPQMTLGPTFWSTSLSFLSTAPPRILSNAWTTDIILSRTKFLDTPPGRPLSIQRLPSRCREMPYQQSDPTAIMLLNMG
jgi:hypothetical protein